MKDRLRWRMTRKSGDSVHSCDNCFLALGTRSRTTTFPFLWLELIHPWNSLLPNPLNLSNFEVSFLLLPRSVIRETAG